MVIVTADPLNPSRLVLTQTTVLYLDKLSDDVLSDEVAKAIRERAVKDLQSNAAVKRLIAKAAQQRLLDMLGETSQEPDNVQPNHS